jgi:hypothetical protein
VFPQPHENCGGRLLLTKPSASSTAEHPILASKFKYVKKFPVHAPQPSPPHCHPSHALHHSITSRDLLSAKMDALGGGLGNVDISKLSDRDKQELQQFVMNESQKARIQSCMPPKTSLPYS